MEKLENEKGKALPVAVIFGGEGAEHEISCLSAEAVVRALEVLKREYISIYIDKRGYWFEIPSGAESVRRIDESRMKPTYPVKIGGSCGFLSEKGIIQISSAIPVLHGDMGEDGVVQGALRCAGISFLGCDTAAGAVITDKAYTKILAENLGIPTVPWFLYIAGGSDLGCGRIAVSEDEALKLASELGYPLFVKPTGAGSSIGACIAREPSEFTVALRYAASIQGRVIIEKNIENPIELECGYFGGEDELFTEPGSIVSSFGFYSFGSKYCGKGKTEISVSASVSDGIKSKVREYSRMLCLLAGVRNFARIDFFLDKDKLYFNEINSFPGMTEDSLYPRMLANAGISLSQAFDRLLSGN